MFLNLKYQLSDCSLILSLMTLAKSFNERRTLRHAERLMFPAEGRNLSDEEHRKFSLTGYQIEPAKLLVSFGNFIFFRRPKANPNYD